MILFVVLDLEVIVIGHCVGLLLYIHRVSFVNTVLKIPYDAEYHFSDEEIEDNGGLFLIILYVN